MLTNTYTDTDDKTQLEKQAGTDYSYIFQLPRRIFGKGRRAINAANGQTIDDRKDDPDGDKKVGRRIKLSLRRMYPKVMGGSYKTRPDIKITLTKRDSQGTHEVVL